MSWLMTGLGGTRLALAVLSATSAASIAVTRAASAFGVASTPAIAPLSSERRSLVGLALLRRGNNV